MTDTPNPGGAWTSRNKPRREEMKYALTTLALLASTAAYAGNDIKQLKQRIEQVNDEDQRLVDGRVSSDGQTLELYTQDMRAGKDGDIARRKVEVDVSSLAGKDGADGADGKDGADGAQGPAGEDGVDGKDGAPGDPASVDWGKIEAMNAVSIAIGGLEMPTPYANGWSWSAGVGGGDKTAVSAGLAYGFSDDFFAYGKAAWADGAEAYFVGIGGRF